MLAVRSRLRTDDFDFSLPEELIAQSPAERRDASRLLCLSRATGEVRHRVFSELPELLTENDLLVLNDARVIPARLLGRKAGTGGRAELLLVRPLAAKADEALRSAPGSMQWQCLGQASKGLKPGQRLEFDEGLTAEVIAAPGGGEYQVRFTSPLSTLEAALAKAGRLPLPPYITRAPEAGDAERYQTVYARSLGSVAAPTAGLHFTEALFQSLAKKGVRRAFVTLDVGPGTFLPVRDGELSQHKMHAERCVLPPPTALAISETKERGGRVVAVGTTVVRTLESLGGTAGETDTTLFITPGYAFKVVDALLTNFHLPKSTLLMLVSAFASRKQVLEAYAAAVAERYRFFSYGDAMWIS